MTTWVKLHRKFVDWEWFQDSKMVHLFVYLLLNANYKDKNWKGKTIKRGQLATGLNKLNIGTGISIMSLRTCLKKLEESGEINRLTNNHYSIITICNYEYYQQKDDKANKQTNKPITDQQQSNNKPITATKEDKEKKKDNNKEYSDEIKNFTLSLFKFFPDKIINNLSETNQLKWVDTIDKLIRIDKYTEYEIVNIISTVRADNFWQKNFLSIPKLRKTDRDGVKYINKFEQLLNIKENEKGTTDRELATVIAETFGNDRPK